MGVNQDQSDNMGIKLSQLGQDVNDAADQDLVFNSSYPYLKIIARGKITLNAGVSQNIYKHNLGYVPGFLIYLLSTSNGFFYAPSNSLLNSSSIQDGDIRINETQLEYISTNTFATDNYTIYYFIFDFDITKNYKAPVVKTSPILSNDLTNDFGIKVLRNDKTNINSSDMRDFSIHSGTRTPLINEITYSNKIEASTTGDYQLRQTLNLDYYPMFVVYTAYNQSSPSYISKDLLNKWVYLSGGYGGSEYSTIDNGQIVYGTTGNFVDVCIVSFKDPFSSSAIPFIEVKT